MSNRFSIEIIERCTRESCLFEEEHMSHLKVENSELNCKLVSRDKDSAGKE